MPRMLLAGLALIALAGCSGGAEHRGGTARTRASATASKSSATQPGTSTASSKRKTAAKPDTAKRNPLTNR